MIQFEFPPGSSGDKEIWLQVWDLLSCRWRSDPRVAHLMIHVTVTVWRIRFGAAEVIFNPPNGNAIYLLTILLYDEPWNLRMKFWKCSSFFNRTFHVYRFFLEMGRQFPHGYLRGGFKLVFSPRTPFSTNYGYVRLLKDLWSFLQLFDQLALNWALFVVVWLWRGEGAREKNPMLEILLPSWRLCILFPSLSQGRWPSRTLFRSHPWFMKDGHFKIINPIVLTWFNKFNLTHLVEEIRTIFRKNNRNNRSNPSICRIFK